MRLTIIAVGRLKAGPERELSERYRLRATQAGRALGFSGPEIIEVPEGRASDPATRLRAEAAAILAAVPAGAAVIVLDERGDPLDSPGFAKLLRGTQEAGHVHCCLVIGGADGTDPQLRQAAYRRLSLGALTWPHQLVRILLCEQVYRAMTILAGHPYHRG